MSACFSCLVQALLLSSAAAHGAELRLQIPNVGVALRGYNIFRGCPSGNAAVDQGFTNSSIYLSSVTGGYSAPDGRYGMPDHVTLMKSVDCSLSFSSIVPSAQLSYAESLRQYVDANLSGYTASSAASNESYQQSLYAASAKLRMVTSTTD